MTLHYWKYKECSGAKASCNDINDKFAATLQQHAVIKFKLIIGILRKKQTIQVSFAGISFIIFSSERKENCF